MEVVSRRFPHASRSNRRRQTVSLRENVRVELRWGLTNACLGFLQQNFAGL